jgi:hypothetical protein
MSGNQCRGGALAGIILTVLVLGVLGLITLGSVGVYVADHWRVTDRDDRGETTVETPFGSLRVRESDRLDPAALGVPVYPGAVREHNSHALANFHFDFGHHHKAFAVAAAGYHTSDSVESVTAFYRNRLPHWLISDKGDGRVELSFTKGGYRRFVAICEDDGETRIGLASVGEPASN